MAGMQKQKEESRSPSPSGELEDGPRDFIPQRQYARSRSRSAKKKQKEKPAAVLKAADTGKRSAPRAFRGSVGLVVAGGGAAARGEGPKQAEAMLGHPPTQSSGSSGSSVRLVPRPSSSSAAGVPDGMFEWILNKDGTEAVLMCWCIGAECDALLQFAKNAASGALNFAKTMDSYSHVLSREHWPARVFDSTAQAVRLTDGLLPGLCAVGCACSTKYRERAASLALTVSAYAHDPEAFRPKMAWTEGLAPAAEWVASQQPSGTRVCGCSPSATKPAAPQAGAGAVTAAPRRPVRLRGSVDATLAHRDKSDAAKKEEQSAECSRGDQSDTVQRLRSELEEESRRAKLSAESNRRLRLDQSDEYKEMVEIVNTLNAELESEERASRSRKEELDRAQECEKRLRAQHEYVMQRVTAEEAAQHAALKAEAAEYQSKLRIALQHSEEAEERETAVDALRRSEAAAFERLEAEMRQQEESFEDEAHAQRETSEEEQQHVESKLTLLEEKAAEIPALERRLDSEHEALRLAEEELSRVTTTNQERIRAIEARFQEELRTAQKETKSQQAAFFAEAKAAKEETAAANKLKGQLSAQKITERRRLQREEAAYEKARATCTEEIETMEEADARHQVLVVEFAEAQEAQKRMEDTEAKLRYELAVAQGTV